MHSGSIYNLYSVHRYVIMDYIYYTGNREMDWISLMPVSMYDSVLCFDITALTQKSFHTTYIYCVLTKQ